MALTSRVQSAWWFSVLFAVIELAFWGRRYMHSGYCSVLLGIGVSKKRARIGRGERGECTHFVGALFLVLSLGCGVSECCCFLRFLIPVQTKRERALEKGGERVTRPASCPIVSGLVSQLGGKQIGNHASFPVVSILYTYTLLFWVMERQGSSKKWNGMESS